MDQTVAPPPQSAATNSDNTTAPPPKLRLMCSYGGHIIPRPHDKTLCYVGGDTRIVTVDRHTTLPKLLNRLIKTLIKSSNANATSFTIKYQLPNEDLDSLISVSTDEDLENMIDEYQRLNSNSRLRLFLFPVQPESVSSIGSLLESTSIKSEEWFVNALNGATSGLSDTSSVNYLLDLDNNNNNNDYDDDNIDNNNNDVVFVQKDGDKKVRYEVQSVPDSPMVETTSSFGSETSLPALANLPPIRTNVDEVKDVPAPALVVMAGVPVGSKVVTLQQQQQYYQQKASMGFDMTSPDSVSSDGSVSNSLSRRKLPVIYQDPATQNQFSTSNNIRAVDQSNIHDPNTRIQDSAYIVSTATPTAQIDPQLHNQPQFIHTAVPPPQYIHHRPSGPVPMAAYYPMYPPQSQLHAPHPPLDQQNVVYYMPMPAARQPPQGYSLPLQTDASPAVSAPPNSQVPPPSSLFTAPRAVVQTTTKTEPPALVYRTVNSGAGASQLVHVPSSQHQIQPQFVAYSHIPSQPIASAAAPAGGGGNYAYEFVDPTQQGQHVYYAAQPLPPQSAAQYQTMTSTMPVEAQTTSSHLPTDNSTKQPVRTSQP